MTYGAVAWPTMVTSELLPMGKPDTDLDPVGPGEIAERLGVAFGTVGTWHFDHILPPPRWQVGRGPIWDWSEVQAWAVATGRLDPSEARSTQPRRHDAHIPELVGTGEIAKRLGISSRAVLKRIHRQQMPPPRWQVSGRGVWIWEDLKDIPTNLRNTDLKHRSP